MDRATWTGGTLTTTYTKDCVADRDKLADLAKFGRWDEFFEFIAKLSGNLAEGYENSWRLRAPDDGNPPSGYTPLHQAAYLRGTPVEVVDRLLKLGAWRLLRTMDGKNQTPLDIARERKNDHLFEILTPQIKRHIEPDVLAALQKGFEEVAMSEMRQPAGNMITKEKVRLPSLEIMMELDTPRIWFPVPGFYGGFNLKLVEGNKLEISSFCRVWGGSGQEHVVEPSGAWRCTAKDLS